MAIWIWIFAAWGISLAALKGKKVRLEHFIWLLLPVDMYGVTVAGVTLKPYMIFCGVLVARMLLMRKQEFSIKSRWSLISGVIIVLLIALNAFNNHSMASLIATVMIAVVWVCNMIYMNDCGVDTPEDILEVLLAAGIGFGAVFVAGDLCLKLNLGLPGIVANTRQEPGFFMSMNNVYDGQFLNVYRLRGFTIDPNAMVGSFLFTVSIAMNRIVMGKGRLREFLGLVLSFWCVLLSNSRMGLICCILIGLISAAVAYTMAAERYKGRIRLLLLAALAVLIIASATGILQNIVQKILSNYENRSGLNDEYGRFTIWKEAVEVLMEKNLFFGVGNGQMQFLTAMSRACHNTWLEFVCAFGLLLGGLTVSHFAAALIIGLCYCFRARTDCFAWTMVLGTLGVMISLVGVDNLTSSYLWFCGSMVAAISGGCWRKRKI